MNFEQDTSYRVLTATRRSRLDLARWRNLGHFNWGSYS